MPGCRSTAEAQHLGRLLAKLVKVGLDPVEACRSALVESLTDDVEVADALLEVVKATFGR